MDFNDLYYFCLIADNGGYTAAERVSGITKSLLSRRMGKLEARLKVRLIQRDSRNFALTAAGQILLGHAREMVKEGFTAYESVTELIAEPSGQVRVSCPTVLAQYHLAPVLPGFMAQYPNVTMSIDATDRTTQVIDERFDLALRASKNLDEEPGFIARTLATIRIVMVASPGYLKQHGTPTTPTILNQLATLSSVLDRHEGELKWELTNQHGQSHTVRHRPVLFCKNPHIQLEAAIQGIGIGLLPETIALPALEKGKLVQLLTDWTPHSHIIHAVFPSRKYMNPAVRAFLDYLVTNLPGTLQAGKNE